MGFPRTVNTYQPPAVEGDFASHNPRASALTIPGGLVAGPTGLTVGRFGWIGADSKTATNYGVGAGAPDGFVHREFGAALITMYLAEYGSLIPAGFPATLFDEGEFFVVNRGNAATTKGQQVYAGYADGVAYFGAAPVGAAATGSMGATFTASGSGTTLTTSAVTGLISAGDTIAAGSGIPAGTTIVKQLTGTAGGAGTYQTSVATTISNAAATSFGTALNVTAVSSGVLSVGDAITGTGIPANATIASQVSGATGGAGLYTLNTPATAYAASTALTVSGGVLTNFVARTVGAPGELVKISTWGKM